VNERKTYTGQFVHTPEQELTGVPQLASSGKEFDFHFSRLSLTFQRAQAVTKLGSISGVLEPGSSA
jgi:hypothetical protein